MFNIERINEDEFEVCFDDYKVRLYNCKEVSSAFINIVCKDIMETMCQDGRIYEKINMEMMLDEAIRGYWWDWRSECKSRVGNKEINLDMCNVYNDEVFKRVKFNYYEDRDKEFKNLEVREEWM